MICLPIEFQFLNQTWQIRADLQRDIGDDLGQCRRDQHEIIINPCQTEQSMTQTIIHELIHSFETTLDLAMTERQVDLIAVSLIHCLRTNPELIAIILGDEQ